MENEARKVAGSHNAEPGILCDGVSILFRDKKAQTEIRKKNHIENGTLTKIILKD